MGTASTLKAQTINIDRSVPRSSTISDRSRILLRAGLALILSCVASLSGVQAQTTVFNDTFRGGSTVNNATPVPAPPSINATAFQIMTDKSYSPAPSVASGHLIYGIGGSTAATLQAQALFTAYPVT